MLLRLPLCRRRGNRHTDSDTDFYAFTLSDIIADIYSNAATDRYPSTDRNASTHRHADRGSSVSDSNAVLQRTDDQLIRIIIRSRRSAAR